MGANLGFIHIIIRPLFSRLLRAFVKLSGQKLMLNEGIAKFLLSWPGLFSVLVLVPLAILFVYFEFATIVSLVRQPLSGERPSLRRAIQRALPTFSSLKGPGALAFGLYALVILPLMPIGLRSSLLPSLTIPNFVTGELVKTTQGSILLLGVYLLLLSLLAVLTFVLPAMVLSRSKFGHALKLNGRTLRSYGPKIFGVFLVISLLNILLFVLPETALYVVFNTTRTTFRQALYLSRGRSLQSILALPLWLVCKGIQLMLMPLVTSLITSLYMQLFTPIPDDPQVLRRVGRWMDDLKEQLVTMGQALLKFLRLVFAWLINKPFIQRHKKLLSVALILSIGLAVLFSGQSMGLVHDLIVIGHRGSAYGVKNTLETAQAAIDSGADYIEADVMLSADGVPMVIHDVNLKRLAGVNKNVYELTAAQLQQLTLSQNGYTGRIPTLEEMAQLCQGKMRLAIEFKPHGHEKQDTIDQTMAVLKKYNAYDKALFVSLEYGIVLQVKAKYPDALVGYCVYGGLGSFDISSLINLNIDFLLVEEQMLSDGLIKACREAWIPLYAWTINDYVTMQDCFSMGVTGIVTDFPDTAMMLLEAHYGPDLHHRYIEINQTPWDESDQDPEDDLEQQLREREEAIEEQSRMHEEQLEQQAEEQEAFVEEQDRLQQEQIEAQDREEEESAKEYSWIPKQLINLPIKPFDNPNFANSQTLVKRVGPYRATAIVNPLVLLFLMLK